MAEEGGAGFVPASFEDLRRDVRRPGPEVADLPSRTSSRDLHDLVAERGFMRTSGWLAAGAVALGAGLILFAYARPMIDAFDAVHTSGQMVADKAGQQMQTVSGTVQDLAGKAAFIKETDEKAISTAKGGIACLAGQGACPNKGSPFK